MRRAYAVELVTPLDTQALMLRSDDEAVRLFTKFAADHAHDVAGYCVAYTYRVSLAYVTGHGFEIPRPSHLPGLHGDLCTWSTQCPHEMLRLLLAVSAA